MKNTKIWPGYRFLKRGIGTFCIGLLVGMVLPLCGFTQNRDMAFHLVLRLDSLASEQPGELIYLQSNKDMYLAGEDLWFKASVLNSRVFVPSPISHTLYLSLVEEKTGKAVWQEKYPVENGFSAGHVYLPDTLTQGEYLLEGFTGSSFFTGSAPLRAVKKIVVKKDMIPVPSFRAEFNRFNYHQGDTIRMTLTARSKNNRPLDTGFDARLVHKGREISSVQAITDDRGKAVLSFVLNQPGKELKVVCLARYDKKQDSLFFDVPDKQGYPVQFNTFAEGGSLIAGLSSKVAFKAVNPEGKPQHVTGTLLENGKELLFFSSLHQGMGAFYLIPQLGYKYQIQLTEPALDSLFELPPVMAQGMNLHLAKKDSGFLEFSVSQYPQYSGQMVYLRGQMRGKVYSLAQGTLDQMLQIKVPMEQFTQQGIAEFTLFDSLMRPVAERLVYLHPERKLNIVATLDKESYKRRAKATLQIKVSDQKGKPVATNLCVSVFDRLYRNEHNSDNILSHCLLSEQLKGRIYDANYYFDENNVDREQALDLLLLTQGWRQYVWNEQQMETDAGAKPLVSDATQGEVRFTRRVVLAPKSGHVVMASNPAVNKQSKLLMADSTGRFDITPQCLQAWAGQYVYLKPMGNEDFKPRISIDDPFSRIGEAMKTRQVYFPISSQKQVTEVVPEVPLQAKMVRLKEVDIQTDGTSPFRDKYLGHLDSLAKANLPTSDHVCIDNYLNCPIHSDSRWNRKPVEGEIYERLVGFEWLEGGAWRAAGIVKEEYHYPKFSEEQLLQEFNLSLIKAYYGKREFYQPDYDKETQSDFPDSRNALLWAPSVVTDEKGEASLSFFCSDVNTDFVGQVEGVGGNGLLGEKDFGFKVLKKK